MGWFFVFYWRYLNDILLLVFILNFDWLLRLFFVFFYSWWWLEVAVDILVCYLRYLHFDLGTCRWPSISYHRQPPLLLHLLLPILTKQPLCLLIINFISITDSEFIKLRSQISLAIKLFNTVLCTLRRTIFIHIFRNIIQLGCLKIWSCNNFLFIKVKTILVVILTNYRSHICHIVFYIIGISV